MRRGLIVLIARLVVLLVAVGFYLWFLPLRIVNGSAGLFITIPALLKIDGDRLVYPDPIHWNYVLLLPISLLIVAVGFELIRLFNRRNTNQ
jgi:hypothetical protein